MASTRQKKNGKINLLLRTTRIIFTPISVLKRPKSTKQLSIVHNLRRGDGEDYYMSDRLSFYTGTEGEQIISVNPEQDSFNAVLIIDI